MSEAKTAVFYGVEDLRLETYLKPEIQAHEILIEVEACAICTWEQRVFTGDKEVEYPFIGGHEIAAKIVAIGADINQEFWHIGDKVVYGVSSSCGDCYYCKIGEAQNCENYNHSKQLKGLPHKGLGGFSNYMVAEPQNLFPYQNVSPLEASLAEPLSCVINSIETANIQYGDTVVIIGCGIMGLLHTLMAVKSGAYVICSDPVATRLPLAQKLGAHVVVNPRQQNLKEVVWQETDGLGADVVFNTTPIYQVAEEAIDLVAQLGTVLFYSSFYPDHPIEISPDKLHKRSYKIVGAANSSAADLIKATRLISRGIIDMAPFISEVYSFTDIVSAVQSAVNSENYRVVVDMTK